MASTSGLTGRICEGIQRSPGADAPQLTRECSSTIRRSSSAMTEPDTVAPARPRTAVPGNLRDADMVWIPGGTFRMGSDKHYPEEAPAHSVTVDGFWIDRTPVTNRDFRKFVTATGHITVAEIAPEAR